MTLHIGSPGTTKEIRRKTFRLRTSNSHPYQWLDGMSEREKRSALHAEIEKNMKNQGERQWGTKKLKFATPNKQKQGGSEMRELRDHHMTSGPMTVQGLDSDLGKGAIAGIRIRISFAEQEIKALDA
jgi:hypothetical protein